MDRNQSTERGLSARAKVEISRLLLVPHRGIDCNPMNIPKLYITSLIAYSYVEFWFYGVYFPSLGSGSACKSGGL